LNNRQTHNPEMKNKALRLVEYLQNLAVLRKKLDRNVSDYQKVLWLSDCPHEKGCFTQAWGRDEEHDPDEWLEVRHRKEPPLPAVPVQCKDWVPPENLLRTKTDLPELLPEITRQIPNPDWREDSDELETMWQTELLEDHPEIDETWYRYIEDQWLPWKEKHDAWEKVQKIYSGLFTIHGEQLRLSEEYELVLGLGLLTWKTPTEQWVRRHLVVADAFLDFDTHLGKFTVRPHTEGAKLRPELDMLDIEEQPAGAEKTAKASLITADDDPWEKGCVEGVLKALVHSIDSKGGYDDSLEANNTDASKKPIVKYAPALILRKRSNKGLINALKQINEQIGNGESIPDEFADLAEIRPKDGPDPGDEPQEAKVTFDGDEGEIFFPKLSNDEQYRIVNKIRSANRVLVQGPPGTGKSHTIANLICHLLATGQRTLITAKTPRALQVLERLLPDKLRPLCINLLGHGTKERDSLERSVDGILLEKADWEEDRAEQDRKESEDSLRRLREEKTSVDRRIREIRESETHRISIAEGAYQGTAARIAEAVNRDRADYDWFRDSVPLNKTCSISAEDLQNVLTKLRQFTPEKRRQLELAWPETLPPSERFAELVKHEASATEAEQSAAHGADERLAEWLARHNPSVSKTIYDAFSSFRDARAKLSAASLPWMNDALRDILGGNSSEWHELLRVTGHVVASIEKLVATADETQIRFPDTISIKSLHDDARKLKEHMESGGKLGWGLFRPEPVKKRLYVIKDVKIDGHQCSTVVHFTNLADALHVRIECEKAWDFWKGKSEKIEGLYVRQLTRLKSLRDALGKALALEELIANCRIAISQYPDMGEPQWADESRITSIISSCRLALARIDKHLASEKISHVENSISQVAAKDGVHPVTNELLNAVRNRDMDGFARCANRIQDLKKQYQHLQKVDEYLSKLRDILPQLKSSIEQTCNEPHWKDRIRHIGDACRWSQARDWIEEYNRQKDVPTLNERAKQIEDGINRMIEKLASIHAWSFCFSRLKEDHRRHMEAWRGCMKRLGKGTGKHAPYWRRQAQGHQNKCREAVPAWVMPLHRVWDTVEPAPGMFDVIIVDEASQCGFEAFPLLYLAKKILIVGDDKQISPEVVGLPRDAVHRRMEEFLYDFEFKSSFDIDRSLFDHGKLRYGTRQITLREHFRCMPEIIRFSNDLCYAGTPLIPLRQYGPDRLKPLESVCIDGYCEGEGSRVRNRPEAEAVVEKIKGMCNDNQYDNKTMGVVVLQGKAQVQLIEDLLRKRLEPEEIEDRRLLCGNPYSFQGDERDIMFLSLVAASNKRIGPFTKLADERRFNVAASRACDMMILFHSVTCNDLSKSDLRWRLLDFFQNKEPQQIAGIGRDELERRAAQDNRSPGNQPPPFDSWFEVDVALELLRKGFRVSSQYPVAGKRIDLVIEGGQARLAVECDGDHWHGPDRYEADMQRQRQLERCGWKFFRVRESAFYANRKDALVGLWQALEKRGISGGSQYDYMPCEEDSEEGCLHESNDDTTENDGGAHGNKDHPSSDSENSGNLPGRPIHRAEEITAMQIQNAIIFVLRERPNQSCTLHSLTSHVLKKVGVRTRGKPRSKFERRVIQGVDYLEKDGYIERYKSKNQRIRFTSLM